MIYTQNCEQICEVAPPNSNAYKKCDCDTKVSIDNTGFILFSLFVGLFIYMYIKYNYKKLKQ